MKKTAQQIQDDIFRRMSAEKKIRTTSSFWNFAKIKFGVNAIYANKEDIHSIMAIIKDQLDYSYLRKWAKKQKTLGLLREMIGLVSKT